MQGYTGTETQVTEPDCIMQGYTGTETQVTEPDCIMQGYTGTETQVTEPDCIMQGPNVNAILDFGDDTLGQLIEASFPTSQTLSDTASSATSMNFGFEFVALPIVPVSDI
jgi:hypothetical protein